jgi:glycosyltransferase involved in cell wall biosynthesis
MRVLFQSRSDALTRWGGDTTQMMKTKAALEASGTSVHIDLGCSPDLSSFDLVHVFNVQTAAHSVQQVNQARSQGVPVVLSPIYWDRRHIDRWAETYEFHEQALVRAAARWLPGLPTLYFKWLSPGRRRLAANIRRMLDAADHLLPNSLAELEILAVLFGMPELRAKSSVVVNAIDTSQGSPTDMPVADDLQLPDGNFVLQVGRFEPIKGQRTLIRAMSERPDVPMVFIGAGLEGAYGQACRALGRARGNVHFLPHVPHESLPSIYKRAKVHALPSMRESPGLVSLEAAVQGANCVVGIHAPVLEYFGDQAWVCDPQNDESVRRAVMDAFEAPRSGRLGEEIRRTFTWEQAGLQTHAAYERVLSRRGRGGA